VPTLSIIIPTIARPLLARILREIVPELQGQDEVLLVGDGHQPDAKRTIEGMDPRIKYHEFGPAHCWGHPQRNWAMERTRGSHLASFDDDDALRPGALETMREVISRFPNRPLMFRMEYGAEILWREPTLACGNVSTQMFVVPNVKGRLGVWGERYEGDFDFIHSTAMLYPGKQRSIVWREEVIAVHGMGGSDPRTR
jgi:hypothetical protein